MWLNLNNSPQNIGPKFLHSNVKKKKKLIANNHKHLRAVGLLVWGVNLFDKLKHGVPKKQKLEKPGAIIRKMFFSYHCGLQYM